MMPDVGESRFGSSFRQCIFIMVLVLQFTDSCCFPLLPDRQLGSRLMEELYENTVQYGELPSIS
jgi:hypothetical protein